MGATVKYATNRLIDSVWTLGYIEQENGITVVSYDRDNEIGYTQEKTLPQVCTIEDSKRNIVGARFRPYQPFSLGGRMFGEAVTVLNPQYVFSYKGEIVNN